MFPRLKNDFIGLAFISLIAGILSLSSCFVDSAAANPGVEMNEVIQSTQFPPDWLNKPIKEIQIETPFPFDKGKIKHFLDIHRGQKATYALIRDNIKRLYISGFFELIEVQGKCVEDGIIIIFKCQKKYLIESIKVQGGYTRLPWLGPTVIKKTDILDKIPLKKGGPFSDKLLRQSESIIVKMFHEDGYWNCAVLPETHADYTDRSVHVTFTINRGPAARIKKFEIEEKKVGIDRLYVIFKQYRFRKWEIYRYQKEKFQKDLKKTEQYYRKLGYYNARCTIKETEYNARTAHITMHLLVDPGPLTIVELDYDHHLWNFYWNIPWLSDKKFFNALLQLTPSDLLPVMKRGKVSRKIVSKGGENLIKLYKSKGFENVAVSIKTGKTEDKKGNRITYTINEGQLVRVKRINILGAHHFTTNQIKGVMNIKEKTINPVSILIIKVKQDLNGLYVTETFAKDLKAIRSLYYENGFMKCTVSGRLRPLTQDYVVLEITVDEGVQTIVSEIVIQGNKKVTTAELTKALTFKVGDPYFPPALEQSRINLLLFYEFRGFLSSPVIKSIQIKPATFLHDYGCQAKVVYTIQEGYQIWFDKPIVTGVIKTKRKVISREFQFKKFDPYSLQKVLQTREKLYKRGIFKDVTFEELPLKHPYYAKTLVYNLEEKKSGSIDIGGGWNSAEGWRVFGTLSDKNLFDYGQYLALNAGRNQDASESKIELLFQERYFANLPIHLNLSIYRSFEAKDPYEIWSSGGTMNFSRVFHYVYRSSLEYRLENIRGSPRKYADTKPSDSFNQAADNSVSLNDFREYLNEFPRRISSVTPKFSVDTRDNPFLPTKGYVGNVQVEFSRYILGSESDFTKFSLQTSSYLPAGFQSVLVTSFNLGLSRDLPVFERFRLGGPSTMRGYAQDEIRPVGADMQLFGNNMILGNVEYRFPILWGFGAQLFYDVGNLWLEPLDTIANYSLVSSIGFGIRLDFPFGPLRLDCGYAMKAGTLDQPVYSFTIGHPF
ncbi:outer membrane protein assembly factor BamA [candidate division CSSED10-310 bacterium]|uniref:Outer membrane protein assembly factor BamA n=1 Tax=candidate division CSSED10-310 bacterium TaxID=2855610 RepID=A0ABV6YY67_UNCC1